ncbi:jg18640, partial [Pararge aegeria aegeria]
ELIGGQSEFHIDLDFKKKSTGMMVGCDDDLFPDMDNDSDDSGDALRNIEHTAERMMLSCPEYHSFKDLASKMIDCVPSGEVKMLILEEGDGPLVPLDAMVTIHYAAYFERAKIPFDSTLTMNSQAPLESPKSDA